MFGEQYSETLLILLNRGKFAGIIWVIMYTNSTTSIKLKANGKAIQSNYAFAGIIQQQSGILDLQSYNIYLFYKAVTATLHFTAALCQALVFSITLCPCSFKTLYLFPGKDYIGNTYYEIPANPREGKRKPSRWYDPPKGQDFQDPIPAEWESWLRMRRFLNSI